MEEKTSNETVSAVPDTQVAGAGKKKILKTVLVVSAILVIILLAVYFGFAYYYAQTIFHKTIINGIDCSGITVDEAELKIKEKVEDYTLNLTFRDGSTNEIRGNDIGYEYVSSGEVQKILEKQDIWRWFLLIFTDKEYEIEENTRFDEDLLKSVFYDLENISEETQIEPVDAYVTYDKYQFIIVPEVEGNLIRPLKLYSEVKHAISNSKTELNIAELDVYEVPEMRKDAAALKLECDQLNKLANVNITYILPESEDVLDGNIVRNWLKVDEDGKYTITEDELREKVTEFVKQMSEKVNSVGTERDFHATLQGDIKVSGGSYGYKINQKEEISRIIENIENHSVTIREPAYTSKEVTTENSGLGDTYIEIDLSNQHLWYYIDGELYVESDIVSGTYTVSSRKTPPGIFLLTYKARNKVLRGQQKEDGTYEYESPVSYWMPFNRGIGLHDATWRGSFGGNIFKYSGSHGCINLPLKMAKAIYAEIDEKTPIILYY